MEPEVGAHGRDSVNLHNMNKDTGDKADPDSLPIHTRLEKHPTIVPVIDLHSAARGTGALHVGAPSKSHRAGRRNVEMRPSPRYRTMKTTPRNTPREAAKQMPRTPRVNDALRVEPPSAMNAPLRTDWNEKTGSGPASGGGGETERGGKSINDYNLLAFACRRANKTREEGQAYFCMGVLYDNKCAYTKALECYDKYLRVCRRTNDIVGEALAYNSLGVDSQYLGGAEHMAAAIGFHTKHRDIADVPGKFIAHTNLGLSFALLGDMDKSALNHQHALRYAIRMSSTAGQSLAIGNLGVTGSLQGDFSTAKACMERHLNLAESLDDHRGRGDASQQLGVLASAQGSFVDAAKNFSEAAKIGGEVWEDGMKEMAQCNLGVVKGNMQFDGFMKGIAEELAKAEEEAIMGRLKSKLDKETAKKQAEAKAGAAAARVKAEQMNASAEGGEGGVDGGNSQEKPPLS
jgi:tetratricopeptide (TPR) repeat protein